MLDLVPWVQIVCDVLFVGRDESGIEVALF